MINPSTGFYRCNRQNFGTKVNALLHSKQTNQPVEWIFHNDVYSRYPWNIEPDLTLDQLYDARARELREQYDYIVLSYSGGADTNNILESFIRQNLHIDEIVTNHITGATKNTTVLDSKVMNSWNFAAEHSLQAIPRLREIHNRIPRTKITILDVSDLVINSLNSFDDVDWVLGRNDHLSVGQLFRYNYFYFNNIKRQFDKNLKIGIIVGADKPRTYIDGMGQFHLYFTDTVVNVAPVNDFNDQYTNAVTELFYWSATTAPLICKQAHVIKRWLEYNPDKQSLWTGINPTAFRLHHERILRNLLYTTWNDTWFQADKSTNWWNTEFDTWFHTNNDLSKQRTLWQNGIDYVSKELSNFVKKDLHGRADGFIPFFQDYYVGPIIKSS